MDRFMQALEGSNRWFADYSFESTILALLLAFVLGQVIAWVYARSHSGLSYSTSFTQSLVLMTVVVSLVMVMVITNLASFLLARTLDRRKEIAVRLALGARRATISRQLLVETSLLGLLGGGAGVLVAWLLVQLLLRVDTGMPLPVELELDLDGTVLFFSFAVSLGCICS